MANITITNNDLGSVVLELVSADDATLRNAAAGVESFPEGTILARHSSDGKLYPFDPAGSNGLNVAKAVLTYDVNDVAATTDVAIRAMTAGKVNATRLSIHDGTTITSAHLDQLRDYGIVPVSVKQLAKIDNPQA